MGEVAQFWAAFFLFLKSDDFLYNAYIIHLCMLKVICYLFFVTLIITACTDFSSGRTGNGADSTKKDSAISVKTAIDKDVYNEELEIKNMIRKFVSIPLL
jgi:ABC-type transport system involved in Fe-S cluster assembly fused permease/ATPase subunit